MKMTGFGDVTDSPRLRDFMELENSIPRVAVFNANPVGLIEEDHLLQRTAETRPLHLSLWQTFQMVTRSLYDNHEYHVLGTSYKTS